MAHDDPEGWEFYNQTVSYAGEDPDIFVLSNLNNVGAVEVNAFQVYSEAVIQKSIREGFGLTVSEGLWKARPVVAGRVGGIVTQIDDGVTGWLVDSSTECAQACLEIMADPGAARARALRGKEHVRTHFLTPRLLRDWLAFQPPARRRHGRQRAHGCRLSVRVPDDADVIGIGSSFLAAAILGVLHYAEAGAVLQFSFGIVALAMLAWTVGVGTECVGARYGPATTGVLQSTLGNLPELFIVIFALRAGEIVIAQTSILGSLLANALLVLGLAIVAGAWRSEDGVMRFNRRLPNDTTMLLMLVVFMITILSTSLTLDDKASEPAIAISSIGAVLILCVYGAWLVNYLRAGAAQEPRSSTSTRLRLASGPGSQCSRPPGSRPRSHRSGSSRRSTRQSRSSASRRRSPDS